MTPLRTRGGTVDRIRYPPAVLDPRSTHDRPRLVATRGGHDPPRLRHDHEPDRWTGWVVFASTYCTIAAQQPNAFSEPLDRTDGIYFTVTVFATVGFGDITPVSQLARVLVTVQMLVGLVAVGLIAKLLFGAVQVAVARRAGTPDRAADDRVHPF